MPKANVSGVLSLLAAALGLVGCEGAAATSDAFYPGPDSDDSAGGCLSEFEPVVARSGARGLLELSYDCRASDCSGYEAFADELRHDVRIDVPHGGVAEFSIETDDASIATATIMHVDLDACAGEARSSVQIEALKPGTTTLRVRNSGVEVDSIEIRIAAAQALTLRASPISAFDFSDADDGIEATPGEPLLVLPQLLEDNARPLLGTPVLTWQSADDQIASVRELAVSDEEELLRSTTAASAVFLDPITAGKTVIVARTSANVAAELEVHVRDKQR